MKFSGSKLKQFRQEQKMELKDFAKKIGISERQVRRYEDGSGANPRMAVWKKIASFFGKKEDDFAELDTKLHSFSTFSAFIESGYKKGDIFYEAIRTTEDITFFYVTGEASIPHLLGPIRVMIDSGQTLLKKIYFASKKMFPQDEAYLKQHSEYYKVLDFDHAVLRSKLILRDFCEMRGLKSFHRHEEWILSESLIFTEEYIFLRPFPIFLQPEDMPVVCIHKGLPVYNTYRKVYSTILDKNKYPENTPESDKKFMKSET